MADPTTAIINLMETVGRKSLDLDRLRGWIDEQPKEHEQPDLFRTAVATAEKKEEKKEDSFSSEAGAEAEADVAKIVRTHRERLIDEAITSPSGAPRCANDSRDHA